MEYLLARLKGRLVETLSYTLSPLKNPLNKSLLLDVGGFAGPVLIQS